jgi:bifunctional DNA-binding transcriptional regulator/antitoxin component of YhaV-PrlF toxin-antitoxin module
MYISTIKITAKGQISLPKKIRDMFKSDIVSVEISDNNEVILSPVQDLAGSLAQYKKDSPLSFTEIREQSWQDNTKVITNKKTNVK